MNALSEGGVIVWVVADATIDGSETGTSFRQALGFMERGLNLHDTMIWKKQNPVPIENRGRYRSAWEFMFVLSLGRPSTCNIIADQRVARPGKISTHAYRQRNGLVRRSIEGRSAEKRKRDNVWEIPIGQPYLGHPATFPYALARDHIRTWTNPGDLVVDPMCGIGTTIRAAKDWGRDGVGIEIHEPYVDIASIRLAQQVMDFSGA